MVWALIPGHKHRLNEQLMDRQNLKNICATPYNKQEVPGRINCLCSLIQHDRIKNDMSNNSSMVVRVFAAMVMSLPSCCLVMTGQFLPSHCLATTGGYKYRHTDWWEEFMKYATEMGSGALIYIPSFIKSGSAIQKLMGEYKDTQTALWLYKPTYNFSK
jgi:hypothetical protein